MDLIQYYIFAGVLCVADYRKSNAVATQRVWGGGVGVELELEGLEGVAFGDRWRQKSPARFARRELWWDGVQKVEVGVELELRTL